jgi:hypothetical protein
MPTLFFHRTVTPAGGGGKLPCRRMLRYSGKLGKKAERVTGGEHWFFLNRSRRCDSMLYNLRIRLIISRANGLFSCERYIL